jgi:hypothetical protein
MVPLLPPRLRRGENYPSSSQYQMKTRMSDQFGNHYSLYVKHTLGPPCLISIIFQAGHMPLMPNSDTYLP